MDGSRHDFKAGLLRAFCGAYGRICRHSGRRTGLMCVAALTGLLAGVGAFLLKTFIAAISSVMTSGLDVTGGNPTLLLLPVAGIFLTGIYTRYILHDNISHGCVRMAEDLKNRIYRLKRHLTYAPVIASSITIGFGGSAGSEGPIAYTGAAIGSNVGKALRLDNQTLRILIGCGAGAGIAGIFKAPVGGALFTLEVLGMELTTMTVIALLIACVCAASVAYVCSGCTLDVTYIPEIPFEFSTTGAVALLGIFCGIFSLYYSFWMERTETILDRISDPWIKNLSAGATLGLLIFLFPTLYGEGYSTVDCLINGDSATLLNDSLFFKSTDRWAQMAIIAGTLAVKAIATQSTNSGGGVGGDFAPTLFSGSMAGFLFASCLNMGLGTSLPVADFAFYGMAGVMAGAIQAPLMAIFLTAEMTGDYGMVFPLAVSAGISYATVTAFSRHVRHVRPAWHHNRHLTNEKTEK